jgi:formylglycine-generating enzyme required for sulfatase activity
VEADYRIEDLEDDLDALAELNAEIKFDLLDTRPRRQGDFRWYDRTLQEFFAAWWLSRHAGPRDLERLRQWRYADPRDETGRTLFGPLWGFLVEMPRAVRRNRQWVPAVGVLFEHGAPRCCEMMYRAWPALWKSAAGRAVLRRWQQEFQQLLAVIGADGEVARAIRDGLQRCPTDPAEDGKPFLMGSPEGEESRRDDEFQHFVSLSPFWMHQYPVTNAQYELFDPDHADERWDWAPGRRSHPARQEAGDHPVVNVTWYQAWCFARWTGNRLPTEAQWEYACRGGATFYQVFHLGDALSSDQANFNGNSPYGGADDGEYLEQTSCVGSYPANGFGLYDMHGNVWEWCADWYAAEFYRAAGQQPNPVNDEPASARVLRGGGWGNYGKSCRSAYRDWDGPGTRHRYAGFRLAAVPDVGARQVKGERRPRSRPE